MARKTRTKLPDLVIVLDFGGSLTKVIFRGRDRNPQVLCMEPEAIELPKSAITNYERQSMGMSALAPADRAWVGVGDQYYALGYLARTQFFGNPGLTQLKYERAFPKALAAVWAAATSLGLNQEFTASVGILLPPGEYKNGENLQHLLKKGLREFETPTGTYQVTLTHYDCKPEGGGVYLMHTANWDWAAQKNKTLAVVMVGYRNASVLLVQRGAVIKRSTSELGFIQLVNSVKAKTSGLDVNQLAEAIATSGNPPDPKILSRCLMSVGDVQRRNELSALRQAIISSREQYSLSLRSWLREELPRQVDEVLLCGGTSEYIHPELSEHFSGSKIVWHGVELPPPLASSELGNRLCDVYSMYEYFLHSVATGACSLSSKEQEAVAVNG
jgi:hypothetical protein